MRAYPPWAGGWMNPSSPCVLHATCCPVSSVCISSQLIIALCPPPGACRWLDELIIALWHDLQAYIEWKAQDSELLRLTGKSLAELTLELPGDVLPHSPAGNRSGAEMSPGFSKQGHTWLLTAANDRVQYLNFAVFCLMTWAGEWLQRGLLAERLCHDADALLAYRCCIKAGGFNLMALTAIMRLAAHCGEAVEVCAHAGCLSTSCLPPQIYIHARHLPLATSAIACHIMLATLARAH
eukprot:1161641-Pelagomonas_calceolata.AAC.2